MSNDFYLGCAVGWALGSVAMWVYFTVFSGLVKSRDEYEVTTNWNRK